jgi:hypothetical protein
MSAQRHRLAVRRAYEKADICELDVRGAGNERFAQPAQNMKGKEKSLPLINK